MRLTICILALVFFNQLQAQTWADSLEVPPSLEIDIDSEYIYGFEYGCVDMPKRFIKYIKREMKYPTEAIENNIQGVVYLSATINPQGRLTDIAIIKGYLYLNEEAIRVLSKSPPWKPAKAAGKPVGSKVIIPLSFKLNADDRHHNQ